MDTWTDALRSSGVKTVAESSVPVSTVPVSTVPVDGDFAVAATEVPTVDRAVTDAATQVPGDLGGVVPVAESPDT